MYDYGKLDCYRSDVMQQIILMSQEKKKQLFYFVRKQFKFNKAKIMYEWIQNIRGYYDR